MIKCAFLLILFAPLAALAQISFNVPLGKTINIPDLQTFNSSGAEVAADSTPTCDVRRNNTDTPLGISGNMVLRTSTTNQYRFQVAVTSANGFVIDDTTNVTCTATVGGVTQNITKLLFRVTGADGLTYQKNVAGQKFPIWFKNAVNVGVTGLTTGNITCQISKDFGSFATTNDTTEAEVGNGLYWIDATQSETNADYIALDCVDGSGASFGHYSTFFTAQK